MKMLFQIAALLVSVGFMQTAQADCYVYVNICAPGLLARPGVLFLDVDSSALTQHNPNRCAERAREYLNYCRTPFGVGYAATYFQENGAWKNATVVGDNYYQGYVVDFANTWVPMKKEY